MNDAEVIRIEAKANDRNGLPAIAEELRAVAGRLEVLEATDAKLYKTADNVPVTEFWSFVYHPVYGDCMPISAGRARPWKTVHYNEIVLLSDCYSTPEAAEAASKQEAAHAHG